MTFKRDWVNNSIMSGRSPPLYCLYTYINRHAGTPDRHRKQNRNNVVHYRWDHRLQIQNLFMTFKRDWVNNSIMSGRSPPLYCLYTYINRHAGTPDRHRKQNRNNVVHYRWDHRLQIPNLFMTFKRDWVNNSIMSGRSPPLYCLYTYINRHAGTPDRHRKQNRNNVVHYHTW